MLILRLCLMLMFVVGSTLANLQFAQSKQPVLKANDGIGSVWPQPQAMTASTVCFPVEVGKFSFTYAVTSKTCNLLTEAFARYEKIIRKSVPENYKVHFRPGITSALSKLVVNLTSPCETIPSEAMNEAYTLDVAAEQSVLYAEAVWGIIRGLETFSQLLWETSTGEVMVNKTSIVDAPRFPFRGVMIDTSRHFLALPVILDNLDAMAYNKFNVLHWHIVDDQSFPFVSKSYPSLSEKGAWSAVHVYTPDDVKEVVEYARLRGIRVVPEFDSPGHTQSWGLGQPGFLTPCYADEKPAGTFGPADPTQETTYTFVKNLWTELRAVFPDNYLHLGGDEVSFACWQSNPHITKWMESQNITGNYAKLEQAYIQRVIDISDQLGFSYIVWQEVIDNGVQAKSDTVVEVWKGNAADELAKVTKLGYKALIAQPWYLNYISYGSDWKKYYNYEPANFEGTDEQKKLLMGGEACMWGEYVDGTNILPRLWPRASAVAERLWSAKDVTDTTAATPRLHQHRCRMIRRGIPAESIWIGHCASEWRN